LRRAPCLPFGSLSSGVRDVELDRVMVLELTIIPDISGLTAVHRLTKCLLRNR
jgi:hypothetical protein